jgi:cysteinyl-tRNA synthetase
VLANMFELVPVINSIKDKHISPDALSAGTMQLFQQYFKKYVEDILGLAGDAEKEDGKLEGVIGLLIEIRKEAKAKKDYATSDKIRQQLQQMGILLKDEKDGGISYSFA